MFGILIFVFLTFYLVYKLNEILGMRVGCHIKKENLRDFSSESTIQETPVSHMDKDVVQVKKIYPAFNVDDFLKKAQKAFEIIFASYAKGDVRTLKSLLAPRIYHAFSMAIEDRKKRKETIEGILLRFISSKIEEISMTDNEIFITVRFETEQSNVLRSENGIVLEGNSDFVEKHTEVWIFSRKKGATDARWYLHEIKSE
ncbi:MAG: Tim44/TimA family putative adaptor protein [Holosporaceae bacterium]|jgi:predicted lipid-binding transport protein (Tim44 family)|nr:Tim44/TimA family putative adaptor protein [Holosporaceae bacterium]